MQGELRIYNTTVNDLPVNSVPLTDDTDFKTREDSLTYDQAGLDLVWHFYDAGNKSWSHTAVTPTTGGGDYDWSNDGDGMYSIGMPDSGGASVDNDTIGWGYFTGYATGVLPWRGPTISFITSAMYAVYGSITSNQYTNPVALDGSGTAMDNLVYLATYLAANACTLTDYVVDNSILAQLMAADGDISSYDKSTDALETIRNRGDSAWLTATSVTVSDKTGFSLTSAGNNAVADALLQRDVDNVEATANEHTLCTIVLAMLESSISGTTWTIKRTDGSTTHAAKTVTADSGAEPITGVS